MFLDIAWALCKCHLRDYHDDTQNHIDGAHPNFNASMTLLWQDRMPAVTADNQAMSQAENALLAMDDQAALNWALTKTASSLQLMLLCWEGCSRPP